MTFFSSSVLLLSEGGFNPLAIDPSATALTLLTFLLLLFILGKFAWKPILDAVESREQRIEDAIKAAEEDRATAQVTLDEYKERVSGVEGEVAALREKARAEGESMRADIVKKAEGEASALTEKAQKDIDLAKTQALEEIRGEAVNLGLAIASKVVDKAVESEDHRRLAEQVVAEVGSVQGGKD